MADNRGTIQDRLLSNISDEYDKSEGSFPYDITKSTAIEFENTDKKIDVVKDKLSIENLQGDELEQRIYERTGIKRKQATYSTNYVTIEGSQGSSIKIGDKVSSDGVDYTALEDKIIDSSLKFKVLVKCDIAGSVGNVPMNAIKYFPITLQGLFKVYNEEAFTNGYNAETDEELLERYYERIKTPATSGNKYHYINWTKEIIGIGDCKVFPLWNGDNTVKVVIVDSNKSPASLELVTKVQEYIDPKGEYIEAENKWTLWGTGTGQAPIGAFCTVSSAIPKILNISFNTIKDPSVDDVTRQKNTEDNINAYIKELVFKENIISYNKIGSIILNSKGILDYSDLKINNTTSNITLTEEEVPVLGVITIV